MHQFTFNTVAEYNAALAAIQELGVDYEAQPEELTIVTDELSTDEIETILSGRK